ncbi:MAG TPA: hypothetical protein VJ904_05615, partial [Tichowtungia sp.]|nr:hypothetical protein [Tichowtungia sp.]
DSCRMLADLIRFETSGKALVVITHDHVGLLGRFDQTLDVAAYSTLDSKDADRVARVSEGASML